MNARPDSIERRSRDTRPQPAWRSGHPATPCKAAMLLLALALPALAQDPATNAAAAVSAKDVVAERTRAMVARLDRVAVPEIEFKDAPLADICSLLRDCTGCYCELGVVSKISAWAEGPLQRRLDREGVRVSISTTNAPLGQIALRAAEQAGAELVAGETFLLFRDRGAPPWDPAPFFARPGADAAAAEEVLDRVRITGSECLYAARRDILNVIQARAAWRDPDGLGIPFGPDGIPPAPSKDGRGEWPSVADMDEYELRATLDRREDGAVCFPMPPRIFLREALEILANAAGVCFVVEPDGSLSVAESGRPAPDAPGDPASARRLPLPAAREATLAALARIRAGDAFAKTEDGPELRDFLRRLDEAARAAEPSGGGLRFDVDPDVPAGTRCHGETIRHLSDGCLRELLDAALFSSRLPWFVRADGTIVIRPAPGSPVSLGKPVPRFMPTADSEGGGDGGAALLCDGFDWNGIATVAPFACTRPFAGCFGPFDMMECERVAETDAGGIAMRYRLSDGRVYAESELLMEQGWNFYEGEQSMSYAVVYRSIDDVWSTNRLASPSDRMERLGIEVRFDPAGMEGGAFAFGDRIVPVGEDGSLGEVPERVARSLPLVAKGRRFRAMLEDCDPDRCIRRPSSDGALRFLVPARPVEGEPMTFRAEISLTLRAEPETPLRTARRAEAERDRAEARLDAWRVPALALSGRPLHETLDAVRAAAVREGADGGEKAPSFRLDFDDERSSVWPKLVPVVESFSATNATLREAVGALAGAAGLAAREECGKVVLGGTIGSDRLPLRLPEAGGAAQARLEPIALTLVKQCEIPEVEFRDGLLSDVLSFLGAAAEEYREFRLPEGFAIRLDPAAGDPDARPRFSIHRMRIPMPELLDAVASNCGLVWRAEGAEIVFHPVTNAPATAPNAALLLFDPAAELRALSRCSPASVELLLEADGAGQELFELAPSLSRSVLASLGNARTERLSARDRANGECFAIILNLPHSELSAALESVGFGPLETKTATGELGPDDPDQWWLSGIRLPGNTNDVHVCFYSEDLPLFNEARVPGLGALLHEVWEARDRMAERPAPLPTEPTEEEKAVRAKLDSIVIDSLEYRNASVVDVLADLGELSREMDESEPDPAKRGVNLVLGIENANQQAPITIKARSISLGAVLDLIADMTHPRLDIRVVGSAVFVGTPSLIVHRMYPIRPDAASLFLGDGKDWRTRLADRGIEWPDGSSVAYLPSIGKLVVANTRKNLARVELALAELTAPSPAEKTHAESAENAEPEPHAESAEFAE